MDSINMLFKTVITTLGAFCGYFLGEWNTVLQILVSIVVIDYITGVIAAGYNGNLKSKIGFRGISKKVMLFLLVGVSAQLDTVFGSHSTIREATIFFFVGNELLSILENAGLMGIKLPNALIKAVEILNNQSKQNKGEK
ncbi:holin (plasmid) [Bacillus sp. JAS24-2]|uniref:phage holin family protein n=1 Tax=Bacillus sp. JAS24-2 TaxID=2217832 RepID=UPI0011EBACED|nr:phage holin family protein [Bacillus sp. JAS24-2]QEL82858.1 holin [Bacillus sp. JAS24-2]